MYITKEYDSPYTKDKIERTTSFTFLSIGYLFFYSFNYKVCGTCKFDLIKKGNGNLNVRENLKGKAILNNPDPLTTAKTKSEKET
jgi:hypothetical protein